MRVQFTTKEEIEGLVYLFTLALKKVGVTLEGSAGVSKLYDELLLSSQKNDKEEIPSEYLKRLYYEWPNMLKDKTYKRGYRVERLNTMAFYVGHDDIHEYMKWYLEAKQDGPIYQKKIRVHWKDLVIGVLSFVVILFFIKWSNTKNISNKNPEDIKETEVIASIDTTIKRAKRTLANEEAKNDSLIQSLHELITLVKNKEINLLAQKSPAIKKGIDNAKSLKNEVVARIIDIDSKYRKKNPPDLVLDAISGIPEISLSSSLEKVEVINLDQVLDSITYPKDLADEGIEGAVLIAVRVASNGNYSDHHVISELNLSPGFTKALEPHLPKLKFLGGDTTNVRWKEILFKFNLVDEGHAKNEIVRYDEARILGVHKTKAKQNSSIARNRTRRTNQPRVKYNGSADIKNMETVVENIQVLIALSHIQNKKPIPYPADKKIMLYVEFEYGECTGYQIRDNIPRKEFMRSLEDYPELQNLLDKEIPNLMGSVTLKINGVKKTLPNFNTSIEINFIYVKELIEMAAQTEKDEVAGLP